MARPKALQGDEAGELLPDLLPAVRAICRRHGIAVDVMGKLELVDVDEQDPPDQAAPKRMGMICRVERYGFEHFIETAIHVARADKGSARGDLIESARRVLAGKWVGPLPPEVAGVVWLRGMIGLASRLGPASPADPTPREKTAIAATSIAVRRRETAALTSLDWIVQPARKDIRKNPGGARGRRSDPKVARVILAAAWTWRATAALSKGIAERNRRASDVKAFAAFCNGLLALAFPSTRRRKPSELAAALALAGSVQPGAAELPRRVHRMGGSRARSTCPPAGRGPNRLAVAV